MKTNESKNLSMNILEVKNLRKRFGENEVLKGININLKKGEVLSIIGSSGGGKTTLLRCLTLLYSYLAFFS